MIFDYSGRETLYLVNVLSTKPNKKSCQRTTKDETLLNLDSEVPNKLGVGT